MKKCGASILVIFSLTLLTTSCNTRCDENMFYRNKDVEFKWLMFYSDSSSAFVVYSTLAETMFYSPGISITKIKDFLPSEMIVHRMGTNEKDEPFSYKSIPGKEFKKNNPRFDTYLIADNDWVVCIPMDQIEITIGSTTNCAEVVSLGLGED